MMSNEKKGFGLWSECPDHVVAAWGARTILEGKSFSILHDRQSWYGDDVGVSKLRGILNSGALKVANEETMRLRASGEMRADKPKTFTLYEDGTVTIKGNTNGSCGYLYIIAYAEKEL